MEYRRSPASVERLEQMIQDFMNRLLDDTPVVSTNGTVSKEEQERRDAEMARQLQREEDERLERDRQRRVEQTLTEEQIAAILGESPIRAHGRRGGASSSHSRSSSGDRDRRRERERRGNRHRVRESTSDEEDELSFVHHSTPLANRRRGAPDRFQVDVSLLLDDSDREDDLNLNDHHSRGDNSLGNVYDGEMTLGDGDDSGGGDSGEESGGSGEGAESGEEMEDSHLNESNAYEANSFVVEDDSDESEEDTDEEVSESDSDEVEEVGEDGTRTNAFVFDMEMFDDARRRLDANHRHIFDQVEEIRRRLQRDRDGDDDGVVQQVMRAERRARVAEEPEERPESPQDENVIRCSDWGHCTICFEDNPYDPVGCLYCQQLIGCRKCTCRWYSAGRGQRAHSPLSLGQSGSNHKQCPLCRHEWELQPEITSMFNLTN